MSPAAWFTCCRPQRTQPKMRQSIYSSSVSNRSAKIKPNRIGNHQANNMQWHIYIFCIKYKLLSTAKENEWKISLSCWLYFLDDSITYRKLYLQGSPIHKFTRSFTGSSCSKISLVSVVEMIGMGVGSEFPCLAGKVQWFSHLKRNKRLL